MSIVESIWQATPLLFAVADSPPEFLKTFTDRVIQPGQAVELTCKASGTPRPVIKWILDGSPITDDGLKWTIQTSENDQEVVKSLLRIRNVQRDDGGEFVCVAQNVVGTKSHRSQYRVYGLPHVRTMKNVTVSAGKDVTVRCYASGYPIDKIQWARGLSFS